MFDPSARCASCGQRGAKCHCARFTPSHGLTLACAACGTAYTLYPTVVVRHRQRGTTTQHLYGSAADFCLACDAPLP